MTNSAETNPEAPDFPIHWQDPEDEQKFWSFYSGFMPEPFTPLERDIIALPIVTGWSKAFAYFQAGTFLVRFFNGYYYDAADISSLPTTVENDGLETKNKCLLAEQYIAQIFPHATSPLFWEDAWLSEAKQHVATMEQFELDQPLPQLLGYLDDLIQWYSRICETHLIMQPLMLMAVSDFQQFYQDLWGEEGIPCHQVVHKKEPHTIRSNRKLWQLSRQILRQPTMKEIFLTAPTTKIMSQLQEMSAGQEILAGINAYLKEYGKQNLAELYVSYPSWREDPTPVLLNLKTYLSQVDRDFEAELCQQQQHHEQALATVRAHIATYPQPLIDQFETLLANAQEATYLLDEHTYWMEMSPNYHLRHVLLAIGRAFQSMGCLAQCDDIFYLHLDELRPLAENPISQEVTINERKANMVRFKQMTPPPFLGTFPTEMPPTNPIMDAFATSFGVPFPPSEDPNLLLGYAASPGVVTGPVKILSSVREMEKLTPGDILVTRMTNPVWTSIFPHVAGIITDNGGMLSHPAIVAREMGIPAVVGVATATTVLHDGQLVELNGATGEIRILAA